MQEITLKLSDKHFEISKMITEGRKIDIAEWIVIHTEGAIRSSLGTPFGEIMGINESEIDNLFTDS